MLPAIKLKRETVVRCAAPGCCSCMNNSRRELGSERPTDGGLWRQAQARTEAKSMNINTAAESRADAIVIAVVYWLLTHD